MKFYFFHFYFFLLITLNLISQEDLGTIDVIGSSPLPGIMIDRNDVPNTSQKITANKFIKIYLKSIADLMNENSLVYL